MPRSAKMRDAGGSNLMLTRGFACGLSALRLSRERAALDINAPLAPVPGRIVWRPVTLLRVGFIECVAQGVRRRRRNQLPQSTTNTGSAKPEPSVAVSLSNVLTSHA